MRDPTRRAAYRHRTGSRGSVTVETREDGEGSMSTASLTWRHCEICGREEGFEAPPCVDGHGGDCPDLVCVGCGTVITVDVVATPTADTSVDAAA
jgi:hypothetical protein